MMTNPTRFALAGLCTVAQSFSPALALFASKDVAPQQTIALARKLSAGTRKLADKPEPPTLPLKSIFCDLRADDTTGTPNLFWPAQPLVMNREALFPIPQPNDAGARLKKLQQDFDEQAKPILAQLVRDPENERLLESLQMLMQRFFTPVPAPDAGDTSLYDHARMTGALAAVMSGMDAGVIQKLSSQPNLAQDNTPIALLVGGDLSGIQDFIYTITSRGAAGALRGRSFYLQLLTDAVMRYTLRELELPMTNVVYAGGGKFFLLARVSDAEVLAKIQRHTSEVLLRHHAGDLYCSIQSVALAARDFFGGEMSKKWGALSEMHQAAKQRRFSDLDAEQLAILFTPAGHGGNKEKECEVCGAEDANIDVGEQTLEFPEGIRKCQQCKSFEDVGDQLRRAETLVYELGDPQDAPARHGKVTDVLAEFGLRATLAEAGESVGNSDRQRIVYALSDDKKSLPNADAQTAVGRRYLTNVTPIVTEADRKLAEDKKLKEIPKVGNVKPFDVMELQARGIKRLGVLMLDVDGLGAIFRDGLGDRATLSRIAHLSFAINLFFEGYVAEIAREVDDKGRLYSVYAGGDDLFFVGAWDAVIALAQQVRADLSKYAGGHPGIHASGAIVLIGGKYPLYRAAQDLKEAERKAKDLAWQHDGKSHRKDALCFLGQALPWSRVGYGDVKPDGNSAAGIKALLRDMQQKSDKGLIRKLASLYDQYAEANQLRVKAGLEKQHYGPWHYLAAYTFARAAKQARPEDREAIEQAGKAIMADGFKGIEWVGLGARWAELEGRDPESTESKIK